MVKESNIEKESQRSIIIRIFNKLVEMNTKFKIAATVMFCLTIFGIFYAWTTNKETTIQIDKAKEDVKEHVSKEMSYFYENVVNDLIVLVNKEKGIPIRALRQIYDSSENVPNTTEDLLSFLREKADQFSEISKKLEAITAQDPEAQRLKALAIESLKNGFLDKANEYLSEAIKKSQARVDDAISAISASVKEHAKLLAIKGELVALSTTRENYIEAIRLYDEASKYVWPIDKNDYGIYQIFKAKTLLALGDAYALPNYLEEAKPILVSLANDYKDHFDVWLNAKMFLAHAYIHTSRIKFDIQSLQKAKELYNELDENIDKIPEQRKAHILNNYGLALNNIADLTGNIEDSKESVVILEKASKLCDREKTRDECNHIDFNIAIGYTALGYKLGDKTIIRKGIVQLEDLLKIFFDSSDNSLLVKTASSICNSYGREAILLEDKVLLDQSINICKKLEESVNFENYPLEWANNQTSISQSYYGLLTIFKEDIPWQTFHSLYDNIFKVYTKELTPRLWSQAKHHFCTMNLGLYRKYLDEVYIDHAIAACHDSISVLNIDDTPFNYVIGILLLSRVYVMKAMIDGDPSWIYKALYILEQAEPNVTADKFPTLYNQFTTLITRIRTTIRKLTSSQ